VRRALVVLLFSLSAFANQLTVDRTTLNTDDTLTITVSLDGTFTSIDSVDVPVQNLRLIGSPAYSSQIAWVNGTLTQRKSYQYQARPIGPGSALVGPIVLETRDGQRDTLAPIAVQVLPDTTGGSNDPAQILRELIATHRDAFFVVCETDKKTAVVGEEIVATWTLYNGTSVEQWEVSNVPRRDDFWSEQLDIGGERPQLVTIGDLSIQKLVIMRLALFPLHSGPVTIGPLEVRAEVMRRSDFGGGFGIFEGSVIDVTRHNAPVTIDVQPVPAGSPVDIVGDIALTCGKATQANGGPIVMNVALSGRANLRTAPVPWWAGKLDGSTQIEEGKLNVVRGADAATMTRQWKLLVFPSRAGPFTLPPLETRAFSPLAGRQELQCNAQTLQVTTSHPERSRGTRGGGGAPSVRPGPSTTLGMTVVAVALLIAAIFLITPRIRRSANLKKRARDLVRRPGDLRTKLHAVLAAHHLDETALLREQSDRGDAYRSLHSRLDFENIDEEVEFRLRDFLQFLK